MIVDFLIKKLSKETLEYVFNFHKRQYFDLKELDQALDALVDVLDSSRKESSKSGNHRTNLKKNVPSRHDKSKVMFPLHVSFALKHIMQTSVPPM